MPTPDAATAPSLYARVVDILALAYHGKHHIPGRVKADSFMCEVNVPGTLSTFDFDTLTRLVVGAHDACVRLTVGSSGPGRVKLMFHLRAREGRTSERHPTMEDAIAQIRSTAYWQMMEVHDAARTSHP